MACLSSRWPLASNVPVREENAQSENPVIGVTKLSLCEGTGIWSGRLELAALFTSKKENWMREKKSGQ